ncbi:hypothetical protein [Mesorhizobium sp. ES1-4]|uniref:hypothetical protein n=1 Tax=Mesorhizobium sp. ES1-4 TaxID=2876627 RepID=UPI001CCA1165|nr:hypothetical protein [Mesorhizobium sp. ES1-4]MBZ9798933.1 hypothetical protein [Mesorhizobium sp. ES1-4]
MAADLVPSVFISAMPGACSDASDHLVKDGVTKEPVPVIGLPAKSPSGEISLKTVLLGTYRKTAGYVEAAHQPKGEPSMITRLLAATVLVIALATSATAQSNGTGSNGSGSTSGTNSGNNGSNGTGSGTSTNSGSGGSATPADPNTTNSTDSSNGMTDRCKDAAGNDIDNNTATGATTSNMQNCNK